MRDGVERVQFDLFSVGGFGFVEFLLLLSATPR